MSFHILPIPTSKLHVSAGAKLFLFPDVQLLERCGYVLALLGRDKLEEQVQWQHHLVGG